MTEATYAPAPEAPSPVSGPVIEDEPIEFIDTYAFGGVRTFVIQEHPRTHEPMQWIEYDVMNEGQKARYQKATNRDIRINRKTDEAMFSADVAADRQALIRAAVSGWKLMRAVPGRGGARSFEEIRFSVPELDRWMLSTNPQIVEDLELAIRKANPWLVTDDATVEEIDEQIAELQELRAQKVNADLVKA